MMLSTTGSLCASWSDMLKCWGKLLRVHNDTPGTGLLLT
jgi:hypothetical protein